MRLLLTGAFLAAAAAAAASGHAATPSMQLPVGVDGVKAFPQGLYSLYSALEPTLVARHCAYQLFATPLEPTNEDFIFNVVPALNGNKAAVSLQSTNFPQYYLALIYNGPEPGRLGITTTYNADDASWQPVAGLAKATLTSLITQTKNSTFAGQYMTLISKLTGICDGNYQPPSGDVVLTDGSNAAAATWDVSNAAPPFALNVTVNAANISHQISPLYVGCHLDPGFTHQPRGFYSQLVVGEIFEEPWNNFTDDVIATVRVDGTVGYNYAAQSLLIQVQSGSGYAYATNRGLGNEGLVFQGSQPYEGYFYALVSGPTGSSATLRVQLRDFTSTTVLASSDFTVYTSSNWQRFDYNMTPTAGTTCEGIAPGSDPSIDCGTNFPTFAHICVRCGGEFAIGVVGSAGMTVHVGYVLLQPGAWGRFGNLPVLQSAVDTLQAMGINTIRQGGTVAQTLAWKQWRGPAEQRQSVGWKWGASLVSGWGPFEFIDMCNTMGIEPVITLRMEQNASDWADLVEYAFGSNSTLWGAQRFADGHPQPYDIRVFELGNEEYNPNWVEQVAAMEARREAVGLPQQFFRYMFPTNTGLNAADAAKAQAAGLPVANILPDIHVGGGGAVEQAIANFQALPNFPQGAINCETNAAIHTMQRALMEASDLNDWFNIAPPVQPRLFARMASFCSERSGHYDAFDQGISFFLPNMTWIQPPGYVHQMINRTWAPNALQVSVDDTYGKGTVSLSAQLTADKSQLVLRFANSYFGNATINVAITGVSVGSQATVWTLGSSNLIGDNTPAQPTAIVPVQSSVAFSPGTPVFVPGNSYAVYLLPVV